MFRIIIVLNLIILSACGASNPTKTDRKTNDSYQPISSIQNKYQSAISEAELLGTELYIQDMAAWVATDFISDQGVLERDNRLRGWITEHADGDHTNDRMLVTFIGEADNELKGLYQVETEFGEVIEESYSYAADGFNLSQDQRSMFRARQTALTTPFEACPSTYNTAVIRLTDDSGSYNIVYLLAGSSKKGDVMAGGNYKIKVNDAGDKILESIPLSKSCIVLRKEENVVALTLSHIVEPTPNAVHVFLSLLHQVPIYVVTIENDITWEVVGNKISIYKYTGE